MDPAPDCTIIVPTSHDRCVFRLHIHCLAARSALLGGLLSGVDAHTTSARLLPSPPAHPVLFLPVPDPSSIHLLFLWIYSGNTLHLQNALDHGHIQWHGLARNVEYLGLSAEIKVFLGRWYRNWFLPVDHSHHSDLDSECDDSGPDGYSSSSSSFTDDSHESNRGRSRNVKPLFHLCKHLRLGTT